MRRRNQINEDSFSYSTFHYGIPVKRLRSGKRIQASEIPVRICPHCGYEMRTWGSGEISCTRCENDIRAGETKSLREICREMGIPTE
jgi:hypothetical protein